MSYAAVDVLSLPLIIAYKDANISGNTENEKIEKTNFNSNN
jgi:hypothetical protein